MRCAHEDQRRTAHNNLLSCFGSEGRGFGGKGLRVEGRWLEDRGLGDSWLGCLARMRTSAAPHTRACFGVLGFEFWGRISGFRVWGQDVRISGFGYRV